MMERYYSGNNGAARVHRATTARFTGRGVRRLPARPGAEQGPRLADRRRGRTCRTASRSTPPTTSRSTNNLTLNLGLRWGYTSPLVEKDDRQANFDLTNAEQLLAGQNGNSRALYEPYYNGWEPRLGFAYRTGDRWVFRGGYGITQYMEGTGANLRLPLNPPFFFESQSDYDADQRRRARSPPASRACRRSTGRPASSAPGIRTCGRSSRSSGTCSPSTCSARARRSTSATSATSRATW